jgi:hypothetical protein
MDITLRSKGEVQRAELREIIPTAKPYAAMRRRA